HWYDLYRFERYIAAHVARDQDLGRVKLVREFIEEIRGFSGSAKQQIVLAQCGLARASLSSFFTNSGEPDRDGIAPLLAALQEHSKQVKPQALGLIGKEHLLACFQAVGRHVNTFKY